MTYGIEIAQMVDTDRIFLDLDNPRHEPLETQHEVIEYLCSDEYVFELAKDLVKHGLSPLELFALVPLKKGKKKNFLVAEGNRRMCALKLLNDPDLAPPKRRRDFENLAQGWKPIPKVFAVVFDDKDDVELWIDRIHGGLQGGIGRKTWSAEQKTRHSGDKKNLLAQTVLDYAEKQGLIEGDQRKGKLTTVQRYLSNSLLREALGLDSSNPEDVCRTRTKDDFELLLGHFISDVLDGTVTSRSNKTLIDNYSRELGSTTGQTGERVPAESIASVPEKKARRKSKRPSKPTALKHIPYDSKIHKSLKDMPNFKLEQLYYSLCDLDLAKHTPLLSVGAWSFLETLTACDGRSSNTDFYSYLNAGKLTQLGLGDKRSTNSIRQAVKRISDFGNSTKHHTKAAAFNGNQLANDIETIGPAILALANNDKA